MVDSPFAPEMTSPHIDQTVLRLRFLETIFITYPDSVDLLLRAWHKFNDLPSKNEDQLHEAVAGASSLEILAERWRAAGAADLFIELETWAKSIKLYTIWAVVTGMRILRWIQMSIEPGKVPNRADARSAITYLQTDLATILSIDPPDSGVAGIFGLILPRYMPTRQSERQFREQSEKIVADYILREFREHREMGLHRPPSAPAEAVHLGWLAVRLLTGKPWRKIAQQEANGTVGHTAVQGAVTRMAQRLGVQLG